MGLLDGLLEGYLLRDKQRQDYDAQAKAHAMRIAQQQLQQDEFTYSKNRDLIADKKYDEQFMERQKQQGIGNALNAIQLGQGLWNQGVPGQQIQSTLGSIAPTLGADPTTFDAFGQLGVNPEIQARKEEKDAARKTREKIAEIQAQVKREAFEQKNLSDAKKLSIKYAMDMANTPEEMEQAANWIRTNLFESTAPTQPTQLQGMPQEQPPAVSPLLQGQPPPMDIMSMLQGGGMPSVGTQGGFNPSAPMGGKLGSQNAYREAQANHLAILDAALPEKLRNEALRLQNMNAKTKAELAFMEKNDPLKYQKTLLEIEATKQRIAEGAERLRQEKEKAPFELAILKARSTAEKKTATEKNAPDIRKAMQGAATQMRLIGEQLRGFEKASTEARRTLDQLPPNTAEYNIAKNEYAAILQSIEDATIVKEAAKADFYHYQGLLGNAGVITPTNSAGKPLPGAAGLPKITPPDAVKARQPGGSLSTRKVERPVPRTGANKANTSALDRLRSKYFGK